MTITLSLTLPGIVEPDLLQSAITGNNRARMEATNIIALHFEAIEPKTIFSVTLETMRIVRSKGVR